MRQRAHEVRRDNRCLWLLQSREDGADGATVRSGRGELVREPRVQSVDARGDVSRATRGGELRPHGPVAAAVGVWGSSWGRLKSYRYHYLRLLTVNPAARAWPMRIGHGLPITTARKNGGPSRWPTSPATDTAGEYDADTNVPRSSSLTRAGVRRQMRPRGPSPRVAIRCRARNPCPAAPYLCTRCLWASKWQGHGAIGAADPRLSALPIVAGGLSRECQESGSNQGHCTALQ